ncbi:homocysteine S-methyltransferase family protein [Roseobacter sp. YSTF-M11]|uniref:Homocysteine S-methyltransferase family protein n=1 Tax=Roseobacter insulae TaxID=2859783 RepID=A0A9X1FWK7_9RHOB|nr:homocysteine S-methyltransferase family protein [Roseobacter insulae]MBW4709056.1 homocysteine S-methyltransferase family protein [Roseobacter insulae]
MKYRHALPQLAGKQMITDGGLETTLVFHEGIELPLFAAFKALETDAGLRAMDVYMQRYARLATDEQRGFVMDTPTWRASARWATELGLSQDDLREIHREAIVTLARLRDARETPASPFVINGVLGPQDDGYAPSRLLTVAQAAAYHKQQIGWFAEFGADMVSAATLTYSAEAIGIVIAARDINIPVSISFTLETDGLLPSGETLRDAIAAVDRATDSYPAYFMINCAHPDHFAHVLEGEWTTRIMGLRANASRMSHAELDACETLDDGNPVELGQLYAGLSDVLPNLTVMGGCCGTDHRHVAEICQATRAA